MSAEDETKVVVDVLVAGAGPSGLLLANELVRRGAGAGRIKVRVVDAALGPSEHSKALAVQLNSLEIFHDLGVAARALSEGKSLACNTVFAGKGCKQELKIKLDSLPGQSPFPGILVLPQSRTEKILLDNLKSLGGNVEYGTELMGFSNTKDGLVECRLRAGGREFTVLARYLVGTDGAHSAVRHGLEMKFTGHKLEGEFLLADCDIDEEGGGKIFDGTGAVGKLEGGMGFFFPYARDGGASWRAIITRREEDSGAQASLAEVQRALDFLPTKATARSPRWISVFALHSRQVESYGSGTTFLAGDAAHIHSPAGGQGMNLGLADSQNLAWKLAMAVQGCASPGLLDTYSEERHPVGRRILTSTDAVFAGMTSPGVLSRAARGILFSSFGRKRILPILSARAPKMVSQLWVNYRASSLSQEVLPWKPWRSWPLHAGDRLPFLTLASTGKSTTTLDLKRGTSFVLVLFCSSEGAADLLLSGLDAAREVLEPIAAGPGLEVSMIVDFMLKADATAGDLCSHASSPAASALSLFRVEDSADFKQKFGLKDGIALVRPDGYVGYLEALGMKSQLSSYVRRLTK